MENFYQSKMMQGYEDPTKLHDSYKETLIPIPCRMIICGPAGSMKTNFVFNFIKKMNCFDDFYLFAKNLNQPLYDAWTKKVKKAEEKEGIHILHTSTTLKNLPPLESFNQNNRHLVIIDDFITDLKKNPIVSEYYVRSRPWNVSPIVIVQSYYEVPTIIRQSADIVVFTKLLNNKNVRMISKEIANDITPEALHDLIKRCTQKKGDVLIINQNDDITTKYRHNWKPIDMSAYIEDRPQEFEDNEPDIGEDDDEGTDHEASRDEPTKVKKQSSTVKFRCHCGKEVSQSQMERHQKSKYHLAHLK